jgi:hypothetical protein
MKQSGKNSDSGLAKRISRLANCYCNCCVLRSQNSVDQIKDSILLLANYRTVAEQMHVIRSVARNSDSTHQAGIMKNMEGLTQGIV